MAQTSISGTPTYNSGTGDRSFSHTVVADQAVFVYACISGLNTDDGVTVNGVSLTRQFTGIRSNTSHHRVALWTMPPNGTSAGSQTVAVDISGSNQCDVLVFNVANCNEFGDVGCIDAEVKGGTGAWSKTWGTPGWESDFLPVIIATNDNTQTLSISGGTSIYSGGSGANKIAMSVTEAEGDLDTVTISMGGTCDMVGMAFLIQNDGEVYEGGAYQPIAWQGVMNGSPNTVYGLPFDGTSVGGSTTSVPLNASPTCSGTARNLRITLSAAPGSGKSYTFTFLKTGSNTTPLTVTIADSATTGELTGVDVVYLRYTEWALAVTSSGSPAFSQTFTVFFEFETGAARTLVFGGGQRNFWSATIGATVKNGAFTPLNLNWASSTLPAQIVVIPGSFTEILACYQSELASGAIYELHLYRSTDGGATFVKQDGTGDTVDTTTTLSGDLTLPGRSRGVRRFILRVEIGDIVYVGATLISGSAGLRGLAMTKFVSAGTGRSMLAGVISGNINTAQRYVHPSGTLTESSSENTAAQEIGTTTDPINVGMLGVGVDNAPGASKSWTWAVRNNGADTAVTAQLSGASELSDVGSAGPISLVAGDDISVGRTSAGTPASSGNARYSIALGIGHGDLEADEADDRDECCRELCFGSFA